MYRKHPASFVSLCLGLAFLFLSQAALGAPTALPNRMGGDDRSPVQLLTSPTWEIALTVLGVRSGWWGDPAMIEPLLRF